MDKEWLKIREAAEAAKSHEETIRRMIRSGRLPAMKTPGGQYRISREDLESLLRPAGK